MRRLSLALIIFVISAAILNAAGSEQFSTGDTGILEINADILKSMTSENFIAGYDATVLVSYNLAGFRFGINLGLLGLSDASGIGNSFALRNDQAILIAADVNRFFPISSTGAISLDLQLGVSMMETGSQTEDTGRQTQTDFAALLRLGYYQQIAGFMSFSVGATAAYILQDFYLGGYLGIGFMM